MGDFMKKLWIFMFGAYAYCFIEILWRGRTHWSMALAGGAVFLTLYFLRKRTNILTFPFVSMGVITSVELIFGVVFNIALKMNVWDYSAMPLNYKGQICLPYSLLWFSLGFPLYYICIFFKNIEKSA